MSETHRIEVSNIKKFNIVKKRFEVKGILVVFCALNNNNYTTVYIQALMELLTISSALIKKKKYKEEWNYLLRYTVSLHCQHNYILYFHILIYL